MVHCTRAVRVLAVERGSPFCSVKPLYYFLIRNQLHSRRCSPENSLNLSGSQGICAAQLRPECPTVCAAPHCAGCACSGSLLHESLTPKYVTVSGHVHNIQNSQTVFLLSQSRIHWRQWEGFPITIWLVKQTVCTSPYSSHSSAMSHQGDYALNLYLDGKSNLCAVVMLVAE